MSLLSRRKSPMPAASAVPSGARAASDLAVRGPMADRMAALDSEGTYREMLAQAAGLSPDQVLAALRRPAAEGDPDPETNTAAPLMWQPASTLARWARDLPSQDPRLKVSALMQPDRLLVALRRLPAKGLPPLDLRGLDLYLDGRLLVDLSAQEGPDPVSPDTAYIPDTGLWIEHPLPQSPQPAQQQAKAARVLEVCLGSRVLAEHRLPPVPEDTGKPPRAEGGFAGLRKGALVVWAVDRGDPTRPVPVDLIWQDGPLRLLISEPARFAATGILADEVPLHKMPLGAQAQVQLGIGARRLKRGQFQIWRRTEGFVVWQVWRLADGGLFGTVVPYQTDQTDPGPALELRPEITAGTAPRAKVLWRPEAPLRADLADHKSFAFGAEGHSFHLTADLPGLTEALATPEAALRLALAPGTRSEECNNPMSISDFDLLKIGESN